MTTTTTNYTPAQLEAWAELGPWFDMDLSGVSNEPPIPSDVIVSCSWPDIIEVACMGRALTATIQEALTNAALIAAAPDLARLVLEKEKEIARLKGLAWIAYHEFNAINARSGGPLDQYGMVTVTHEYWQAITDLFAKAAGETTPWPTENAKAIFEEINRQAMKETSDE